MKFAYAQRLKIGDPAFNESVNDVSFFTEYIEQSMVV